MPKKAKPTVNESSATNIQHSSNVTPGPKRPARSNKSILSLLFDSRFHRALSLVSVAATYAPLSQLVLSPIYGSIPSSVYHKYVVLGSAMISFALKGLSLPKWVEKALPAFAFWIPTIHFVLFKFSATLGNPLGPLVTELSTLFPLIALSMHMSNRLLDEMDFGFLGDQFAETGPAMFCYLFFVIFQRSMKNILPGWMGGHVVFSRIGFQLLLATIYGLLLPPSLFWPALPSVAFTLIANTHTPLARTNEVLNNTLALYDFTLLERRDSLTGYLSVLQDNKNNFRVMRCDHSLLGGEWTLPPDPISPRRVAEPVYAVFTMLEAVRLVQRAKDKDASQECALTIGLGVGTVPSAFIAHGINTTIIELDPVVHELATKYFNLPKNHSGFIGDAVAVVEGVLDQDPNYWQARYDYIVHDVFTGGAEPVQLFTYEFLSKLDLLLKPNGVIAINYAGDLSTSSPSIIYRTIKEIFPSCRVFREDEQVAEDGTKAAGVKDDNGQFTNMVFICTKSTSPVAFRKPVEADFLGSNSRRAYMLPKHEVLPEKFQRNGDLLTRSNMKELQKLQVQSAIGHWKLMKKVLPDAVWGNW